MYVKAAVKHKANEKKCDSYVFQSIVFAEIKYVYTFDFKLNVIEIIYRTTGKYITNQLKTMTFNNYNIKGLRESQSKKSNDIVLLKIK